MREEVYDISGMHCAACSASVEKVTRRLPGVERSDVNLVAERMTIVYDETQVTPEQIVAKVEKAGFGAKLHQEKQEAASVQTGEDPEELELRRKKRELIVSAIFSCALLYAALGLMLPVGLPALPLPDLFSMHSHPMNFAVLQLMLAIPVLYCGRNFFINGFQALFHGNPNMDSLVAIGSACSFVYSVVMMFLITDDVHGHVHNLYYESSAVVLTLVFKYAPMGGVLIAFQKYNPFKGIWGSEWVGFKNFTRFMSSPDFQRYLINTLKLSVYGLLWGFPIPILLAFLLNRIESKKIKQKVQLVLYMPNFISVIVLCGIVRVLLSVTGPVNGLLHTSINFMTLPEVFRPIYIISGIWQGAGWASIMYTASLSNASKDLKEAAMIDGANLIQQIMTVEWPAIKDMVVIQFILQAGNIMSIGFEKAYALHTDLNLNTAEIIATYVYKKGLLDGDYSFSTAVGLFNTIVNVILLIAVNKIVAKMNDGKGL